MLPPPDNFSSVEIRLLSRDDYKILFRCIASLLSYTCDPVRRTVTVERTVGKVMLTLRF